MLGNRRYSFAAFLLPNLFMYAQASGVAMLGVQCVVIVFLAAMLAIAFKPDPATQPRNPVAVLGVALPVQLGAYFLAWMLGYGVEVLWTVTGTHPLNMPVPPKGGTIEADRAEGKAILLEVVSMTAGLIARFSHALQEDAAPYGENTEIEEKDKE